MTERLRAVFDTNVYVSAFLRELRRVQLEAALEASAGAWQDADHPELADGPAIDRWIAEGRTQMGWNRPEEA